jgi:RNA polymerase sigma-70 factor (ECF subfamily)
MSQHHLVRLFERFRTQGSTAALARVFDETAPALFAVARRIARESADAEDAVQATFLVAIERAATWDAERPLEPWLFGILVRQLGLARRKAARVVDPQRLDAERIEDPTLDVERSELVATVAEAVQQLPEHERAVLEPWLFDELRGSDLARRVGVTGSTLRMRLRRGLARLRRALPAGLGATAVVLSAVDRSALANTKASVLAAAAKSGGAGTAAAAAGGAATSFGVKAAAAALVAAAVLGGGALWRARPERPDSTTRPVSSASTPDAADRVAAGSAATAVALSARRQSEERGGARDPSGPIAATTVTLGVEKGALSAAPAEVLAGVVVDAHGAPVAGARVLVFDDDAQIGGAMGEATTADDGTFRVRGLEAGGVHVVAEKEGVGRAARQTASMAADLKLEIGVGKRFEGRVVDEAGMPVAHATLELADDDARFVGVQRTTADGDGRYVFDVVHGRVRFVRAEVAAPKRFGFTVLDAADDDSSAPTDVVVRPMRRVELTVAARGDGRPVANALVIVRAGGDALGAAGLDVRGAKWLDVLEPYARGASSDASGRVEVDGVPVCDACSVAVAAPGFAPTARSFTTAGDTPVVDRVELEPACAIEGVVRRSDGTPVADAAVAVEPATPLRELRARPGSLDSLRSIIVGTARPFALETRTRADGSFRLEGLSPLAACSLRVESQRRAAYAWIDALHPGEVRRDVVVTFDAKVRIEGTIVAEDGPVPEKTQLWLQPCSDLAVVDRAGRFSFELAPHGAATIWAVAPGYVHARCDVAAPVPAESRVAITLRRGASISGTVVDAQRRAVAGARLIVWPAEPTFEERRKTGGWISEVNLALATTRNDGAFEIRGLPERKLRLVVSAEGFGEEELTPIEPGSRDLSVTLPKAK